MIPISWNWLKECRIRKEMMKSKITDTNEWQMKKKTEEKLCQEGVWCYSCRNCTNKIGTTNFPWKIELKLVLSKSASKSAVNEWLTIILISRKKSNNKMQKTKNKLVKLIVGNLIRSFLDVIILIWFIAILAFTITNTQLICIHLFHWHYD